MVGWVVIIELELGAKRMWHKL